MERFNFMQRGLRRLIGLPAAGISASLPVAELPLPGPPAVITAPLPSKPDKVRGLPRASVADALGGSGPGLSDYFQPYYTALEAKAKETLARAGASALAPQTITAPVVTIPVAKAATPAPATDKSGTPVAAPTPPALTTNEYQAALDDLIEGLQEILQKLKDDLGNDAPDDDDTETTACIAQGRREDALRLIAARGTKLARRHPVYGLKGKALIVAATRDQLQANGIAIPFASAPVIPGSTAGLTGRALVTAAFRKQLHNL